MRIEKPTPIDEKMELDPERYFISSTDLQGIITSVNVYFSKISGYSVNPHKNEKKVFT